MPIPLLWAAVFTQALLTSLVLTPLTARWALRWGMMDAPGERKIHQRVMPRSGGVAIFIAFAGTLVVGAVALAVAIQADWQGGGLAPYRANLPGLVPRMAAILGGMTLLFAVGLLDDRFALGPRLKLVAQIVSALPLLVVGVRVDVFLQEWLPHGVAWTAGAALTIGWVVLLTNSMNFLDNMDGLTGGVCVVMSLVLAGFSILSGHVFMTAAYLALTGAVLGFLPSNWSPARLFMGDSGSLTIGYALAALTINSRFASPDSPTGLPVLIPVIILSVPLFDTLSVLFIRWRSGAPLMRGDTNHLSHRLVALGFSRPQAVVFICVLTLVSALMALPLLYLPLEGAALHVLAIGALFCLIFILERVARKNLDRSPAGAPPVAPLVALDRSALESES